MWLADWIAIQRGVDVAEDWRDTYRTASAAARILKDAGGMAAHIDRCTAPFGIVRTDTPKRGDIAIVALPAGPTGAIVVASTVAVLTGSGLGFARLPIEAAWDI